MTTQAVKQRRASTIFQGLVWVAYDANTCRFADSGCRRGRTAEVGFTTSQSRYREQQLY